MWYILDENDNPVAANPLVAGRWFGDKSNNHKRVIAVDEFENDVSLSTVFLALDHSHTPGKVLLYESLWFGGPLDGEMRRYSTREEALAGHHEMLAEYNSKREMMEATEKIVKKIIEKNL